MDEKRIRGVNAYYTCSECDGQGGFGHGYDDTGNLPVMCGYCDGKGLRPIIIDDEYQIDPEIAKQVIEGFAKPGF